MKGLKIFSLAFFSYLFLSVYSNYFDGGLRDVIYSRGFYPSMVVLGVVYALIFFGFFAVGYRVGLSPPGWFYAALLFVVSFSEYPFGPIVVVMVIVAVYCLKEHFTRVLAIYSILTGLLVPLIFYTVFGVPFFHRGLRYELVGPLVASAFLGAAGLVYTGASLKLKTVVLALLSIIFILGTFRSLLLLIYLAYFLDLYLRGAFRGDLRAPLAGGIFLGVLILWMSGGVDALLVRVGFTFLVFHNIVRLSLPWGIYHGHLLLSGDPRGTVGALFGTSVHYTYFFFGQAVADFGVVGVLEAFLLGLFLRDSEDDPKTFAFVLAMFIYAMDPGIDNLILSFVLGALLIKKLS
ncbi:hypothetical protein [Thermococcus sp.]|uniref:hypothetical protein n=1 Tax=Thermococcus sp. TaxID=35749 RepID=UPI0026105014|nr:hypothetical protein [Thermococcus sp.]